MTERPDPQHSWALAEQATASDPSTAMVHFQRSVRDGLDGSRRRVLAALHASWASARPTLPAELRRAAHVISGPQSDSTFGDAALVVRAMESLGVPSVIVATECGVEDRGDFEERADALAGSIRAQADVCFFHAGLEDQIATRIAGLRPCAVQIGVSRLREPEADFFDGVIHQRRFTLETTWSNRPAEWVPPASDIESRIAFAEPLERSGLDPAATTFSITFGELPKLSQSGFCRAVIAILQRFPRHMHLLAATGDVRSARNLLHAEGVLPRVRFLPPTSDIATLLPAVDVALVPFPNVDPHRIIDCMGAGIPPVALRGTPETPEAVADELLPSGVDPAETERDYIDRAAALIRDAGLRQRAGDACRQRYRDAHRPDIVARRWLGLANRCFHILRSPSSGS